MEIVELLALLPQLIVATGIFFALILISWQRTQRIISLFTKGILILALIAVITGFSGDSITVTPLVSVDDYSRYAFVLVCLIGLCVVYLSRLMLSRQIEVHDEYYLLVLLVVLGAGILVVSNHFASLFLGFELLSIALVGLVGYLREKNSAVETGFKYLILSASASSFMLLGIAFIYAHTGSLSFAVDTYSANPQITINGLYQLGFILFFSGVAFKLSLVPFHFWTPDVYQGAPTPVTLLLATISKLAMFIVLVKCCFAMQQLKIIQHSGVGDVISIIAISSMLAGNVLALQQKSIKRILGYSSIAHMGYLLIILAIGSRSGVAFAWQSTLYYLTAYIIATVSIFTVITIYELNNQQCHQQSSQQNTDVMVNDLKGLFWHKPLLAILALVGVLGLAGIPLTAGFIGKFYLISYASQQHLWFLLASLIIGSGIALAYYLPMIFQLFGEVNPIETDLQSVDKNTNWQFGYSKVFVVMLTFLGIGLGIFPDTLSHLLVSLGS